MAKVYEALRRAEQERRRRAEEVAHEAPRLEWEPEAPAGTAPAPGARDPLWQRLWRRARGVAEDAGDLNKRRIALLQPDSYVSEQFRALRSRIDALESSERPLRILAIASALPGEGKTTAAINLALMTGLSLGRRVLLVDCDLRRPKIHRTLSVRPEAGLGEVLQGEASLEDAIVRVDGVNLDVLAVRGRPSNPSELLGSPAMRELVSKLAQSYDRIILDTPAALGLPDAKVVGDQCDGIVMVVRADHTPHEDVQTVLEVLDRRRVLGTVLNGTHEHQRRYGYVS